MQPLQYGVSYLRMVIIKSGTLKYRYFKERRSMFLWDQCLWSCPRPTDLVQVERKARNLNKFTVLKKKKSIPVLSYYGENWQKEILDLCS